MKTVSITAALALATTMGLAAPLAAQDSASAQDVVAPDAVHYDEYGAVAEPLTETAGDAAAGQTVMTTRGLGNCVACHQVSVLDAVPFQGEIGPPLDGAGDRWTEADLRGIIANAKMTFEGSMMPSFYKSSGYIRPGNGFTGKAGTEPLPPLLTAQQVEDVVAYLLTLKEG
ncbi:MAG: sulfur oxidation c-type cytochrome SoxX [Confluentimicrobium sp.]|nr:sulfur oxidation c-type cytochrome SoxX [Actibacterium sp.]MBF53483.1 sulfur oxidation c-type cytochrome SoxX [Actibacterium sp.]OWU71903.1 monoheme cytochrome C SoxX [Roseovarius sp. 22II1-1F6A]|tara:strand:- start:517 stop:1029 length:513 start_codon:yes stop_codon:yes gene_type:complete